MGIEIIKKYFADLTAVQLSQFERLKVLYEDWNSKINVISRKDIDNLYEHHVLHSLSIVKFVCFQDSARILDVGTGGGFPGIPLAIACPHCRFVLIDSIGKKIRVGQEVANAIGLKNVVLLHENARDEKGKYDFIVSRAVMQAPELVQMTQKNISSQSRHELPNGLICLKGGELMEEGIAAMQKVAPAVKRGSSYQITEISAWFKEPFFESKKILYVPLSK